ncbi:unnamed protein product [Effrenium voratum]|nr:unnamed protein product [Effrenium voratum]
MTGCRCCVFLTIFTLSVVFGKSLPKHVSLVKARFGDTLGSGAAGNRLRVQRLRRADLLAAASCLFVTFCWPLAGGSNSCYWGLFSWAPVRIGVNSAFEQCFRLCFDIEAYCPGLRCFRCHGR